MWTGVLDANAIIGLVKGGVFALLALLYRSLYVPRAVREEIIGQGRTGETELAQALGVWITEVVPSHATLQQFPLTLSLADRQVLAVAVEQGADHVITGDDRVIRQASALGLTWIRATDVVVLLKREGHLSEVKSVLDRMRQASFGIDDPLYQQALAAAGE
jgi:predicted nucleic acid-binding protein